MTITAELMKFWPTGQIVWPVTVERMRQKKTLSKEGIYNGKLIEYTYLMTLPRYNRVGVSEASSTPCNV